MLSKNLPLENISALCVMSNLLLKYIYTINLILPHMETIFFSSYNLFMSRLTILYYCSKKLYTLEIIKVISTDSNLQNIKKSCR